MKQFLHSFWRSVFVTLLGVSCFSPSFSQSEKASFWEAGITMGPSNFLGDLGGRLGKGTTFLKDNNIQMTKFTFGGFLEYYPTEAIGIRLSANVGTLEGDDAIIKGQGGFEEARKMRNSNFKSKLLEGFVALEVYPTTFFEYDPSDVWGKLRPYGLIGVGLFNFKPKGFDNVTNQWVDLKPLRTEGQGFNEFPDRKEYKLTQMNIPMGVGVKYFLNDNVGLSMEIVHRKTFTDYIDDVSADYVDPSLFYNYMPLAQAQLAERMANKSLPGNGYPNGFSAGMKRGTPDNKDSYYTVGFKLSFRINTEDRYGNSTRCPIIF